MRDKLLMTGRIAVAYAAFAYFGSLVSLLPGSTIPVFMPAGGIALAALLLRGNAAIPGIFIGALLANALLAPEVPDGPIAPVGIFIIVGLTLGPVVASALLKRYAPSAPVWSSARDLMLGTACIAVACVLSTSIGISTLAYLQLLPSRYPLDAYGMWWLGEVAGMLVITPGAFLLGEQVITRTPSAAHPGNIAPPSLVYAAFVTVGIACFAVLWDRESGQMTISLDRDAGLSADSLEQALQVAGRDLESVRALIASHARVGEDAFLRYTSAEFDSREPHPFAQAVGWAPRVTDPRAWELAQMSGGRPRVSLFEVDSSGRQVPASGRSDYFPVALIYPLDDVNRSAIGFDLGSEAVRRRTIETARDTGELSMGAPIYLVQSEGREPGMFMCWPIYREGAPLETVALRREAMTGIASGVYHVGTVLNAALSDTGADISLHIFDTSQPDGQQWYHSRPSPLLAASIPQSAPTLEALTSGFHGMAEMEFTANTWAVLATPGATYEQQIRTDIPLAAFGLILLLGMGMSAILIGRITTRKQFDAERRKTEDALHDARAANEAKSYFMAAASHDIKQPLYALGILTDTLLMTNSPDTMKPILKSLRRSIREMSQHFDTLMDVGRFQDGSFEPGTVEFNLGELGRRIDLELAPLCEEKGLRWMLDFDDVDLSSDPELLLRLIRNLLINAVRYTEAGEIRCRAKRRGDFVEFEVSDTGPGLPPDQQKLALAEVVQLRTDEIHTSGLGLGLSIVNRISRSLDLDLRVVSAEGQGTSFTFRVALTTADAAARAD